MSTSSQDLTHFSPSGASEGFGPSSLQELHCSSFIDFSFTPNFFAVAFRGLCLGVDAFRGLGFFGVELAPCNSSLKTASGLPASTQVVYHQRRLASRCDDGYLELSTGNTPIAPNPAWMFRLDRPSCQTSVSKLTNWAFLSGPLASHWLVHSFSCCSHNLFNGPIQATYKGCRRPLVCGRSWTIVMSSDLAFSINCSVTCVRWPPQIKSKG